MNNSFDTKYQSFFLYIRIEDEKETDIIKIWSTVHGLASLACIPSVEVSFDWIEKIKGDILIK